MHIISINVVAAVPADRDLQVMMHERGHLACSCLLLHLPPTAALSVRAASSDQREETRDDEENKKEGERGEVRLFQSTKAPLHQLWPARRDGEEQ